MRSGILRMIVSGCVMTASGTSFRWVNAAPVQVPSASGHEFRQSNSNSEYMQALEKLQTMDSDGLRASLVSPAFFQSLGWIGRTACVNYVCTVLALEQCRRVLDFALNDDALVVRDHALRILISSPRFTETEKTNAAERSVEDPRNFRKGRPFWIVERAKGFLNGRKNQALLRD
jgi:hypothetical protein